MNNGKHQKKAQREGIDEFCKRLGIKQPQEKTAWSLLLTEARSSRCQSSIKISKQRAGSQHALRRVCLRSGSNFHTYCNYVCQTPLDSPADKRSAGREHHISPMILTESRNHRTWRSEPNRSIYWRRGPDESFDCQLPAEARSELEEIPPPQVYRASEIPTYRPAPSPWPEFVLWPPPPVSALRPPVMPGAGQPAQSVSRSGTGI
jgi:hypothetical protein